MLVDLNNTDKEIIEAIMVPDFQGKDILWEQMKYAVGKREFCGDYIFIHIDVDKSYPHYPYPWRVPVSMTYHLTDSYPVDFLLHIIDGYISIIEIMNVAIERLSFRKENVIQVSYRYKDNNGNDNDIDLC